MPELPEVEFAARQLRRWMVGRRVLRAEAEATRVLKGAKPSTVEKALAGRTLEAVERHGKHLFLRFDAGVALDGHLGMTGKFVRTSEGAAPQKYSRLRFVLDDGSTVHYRDPRLFGHMALVEPASFEAARAKLGPDLLHEKVTPALVAGRLSRTKRPLKVALMDQAVVAGLGNIHAAEALYRAKLSPKRRADTLTHEEHVALARGIRETLKYALGLDDGEEEIAYVEEPGTANPFLVYGRKGERCRRCAKGFRSFTQGGRTTWFCPGCQR